MPGRLTPPIPASELPQWCSNALTRVPDQLPAAGWTTIPAGLLTTIRVPMPKTFETHEDILDGFRALTAPGTDFIEHANGSDVNLFYVRVRNYRGTDRYFSIVINRWHDNVNSMFGEASRLDPSKDTIHFLPRSIGAYPNYFFEVDGEELPEFFDMLENFDGSDEYIAKFLKFGVNRADDDFWESYDRFQADLDQSDPLHTGLYDLNRYHPVALSPDERAR